MDLRKNKTITLSFDNDCIIIDDPPPTRPTRPQPNLNGLFIDLTSDSDVEMPPAKIAVPSKTIEFSMNLSDSMIIKKELPLNNVLNTMDYNNNNQPCCSRSLNRSRPAPKPKILLENTEEFICSLCLSFIPAKLGVTLKECLHNFCRPCLIEKVFKSHDTQSGAVKCPLEIENCDKHVLDVELKELLGDEYVVFQEQIKYNMEVALEAEARRKELEKQSILPLLLNMTDLVTIPNFEPFECTICFVEIDVGEGIILQNCLHQFCKECLAGCILAAEEFEVKCPFIENEVPCKEILREIEVRSLVSEDMFEKHLQKSLKLAENANELTFHCRTPDCPTFVEVGEGITNFVCQGCKQLNCIPCKAIHVGKSCIEYQEEVNPDLKTARVFNENFESESAIEKMILEEKAMRCPRCSIPVEKIAGCDFVVCTSCKLGLCWVTKKPRNDLTKADGKIIKGCGCNVNGIKCHPNCGNCH